MSWQQRFLLPVAFVSALSVTDAGAAAAGLGPLSTFVQAPDASYRYSVGSTWREGDLTLTSLRLTSQTFRGTAWQHNLTVAMPRQPITREHVLLLIGGGRRDQLPLGRQSRGPIGDEDLANLAALATAVQIPVALLDQIPNQPLFDGLIEDQIIAYTVRAFFQSGDPSWPLLMPMVKAASRAMDALTAYAKEVWHTELRGFTLSGESKRGWTTYLTAAIDPRVKAIVPIVFDMLNIPNQLAHQKAVWGAYSEELGDYAAQGLPALLATPRGDELLALIDPYRYRPSLSQPKLIVLGTNDRYWPVDAASAYYPELPGAKYLLYVAQAGHDAAHHRVVAEARATMALAAAGMLTLPDFRPESGLEAASGAGFLRLNAKPMPERLTLHVASAPTADLRQAAWRSESMPAPSADGAYRIAPLAGIYQAVYSEATFRLGSREFIACSPVVLIPPHP